MCESSKAQGVHRCTAAHCIKVAETKVSEGDFASSHTTVITSRSISSTQNNTIGQTKVGLYVIHAAVWLTGSMMTRSSLTLSDETRRVSRSRRGTDETKDSAIYDAAFSKWRRQERKGFDASQLFFVISTCHQTTADEMVGHSWNTGTTFLFHTLKFFWFSPFFFIYGTEVKPHVNIHVCHEHTDECSQNSCFKPESRTFPLSTFEETKGKKVRTVR